MRNVTAFIIFIKIKIVNPYVYLINKCVKYCDLRNVDFESSLKNFYDLKLVPSVLENYKSSKTILLSSSLPKCYCTFILYISMHE